MLYKTFGFTEEQKLMRDSVLNLLDQILPENEIRRLDNASEYPEKAFSALAKGGWLALPFKEIYGGVDASYKDLAVFIEALGYHHYGLRSAFMTTAIYGGMHLQFHASDELRENILPSLKEGKVKMAIAYTEPQSGSDAAGIRTRAIRNGNDYFVTGQKVYITNAHVADYIIATAKTTPNGGRNGLSLFLIDTRSEGLRIQKMESLGTRTSSPNEIFMDNVKVPSNHLIGSENEAWPMLMRGLNLERLLLAATSAGHSLKILEVAQRFARDRISFGRPIAKNQAIGHKFADMHMLTETSRLATFHAAEIMDTSEDAVLETTTAKIMATENNFKVADMGMQIMGGAGYVAGEMQRLFREARLGPIGGGTNEILRNVISSRLNI